MVTGLVGHDDACRADPAALDGLNHDALGRRQRRESTEHRVTVGAGVEQRGERHVAGDPGERVEPGNGGHARRARWSHARATAQAAPKPLSMPTTVTPAAHEASMASSAVTPPRLAP